MTAPETARPISPNIQHYRPQLTSVLSIANRVAGVGLSLAATALVAVLTAAALGPEPYERLRRALTGPLGVLTLVLATFALFLHLCGGIRHLLWDLGFGFELRSIYVSGWIVVAASALLTMATWTAAILLGAWR